MRDLIVVVPGITGSALRRGDQVVWDLSVAAVAHGVVHTCQVLESLRLPDGFGDEEPDPESQLDPAGLIVGWHLWPGFWAGTGYGALLHRLRRLYPDPKQVVEFAYDWRLSNRIIARRLKQTVETELAKWQHRPGHADARVIYICHSMGGLLTRYYLEVLGGRETCRRLITIGTPYSGSVKAIKVLAGGYIPLLPRLEDRLIRVARTLPAIRQLLPTYHCVLTDGDPATLTTADLPDLPATAVRDAQTLRLETTTALERNGSPTYERYAFGGRSQPTDQSVSNTLSGLRYHRIHRGINHAGDGTVPLFSSVAPDDKTTAAGIYHAARHSGLQRHDLLIDQIFDKVKGIDLGTTLAPPIELALYMAEIARAGEDIPIRVTADLPDLLLRVSVDHPNHTSLNTQIPLQPDGNNNYTAALQLPPGTWHVEVEALAVTPPARVSELLIVEPSALTNS